MIMNHVVLVSEIKNVKSSLPLKRMYSHVGGASMSLVCHKLLEQCPIFYRQLDNNYTSTINVMLIACAKANKQQRIQKTIKQIKHREPISDSTWEDLQIKCGVLWESNPSDSYKMDLFYYQQYHKWPLNASDKAIVETICKCLSRIVSMIIT